MRAKPKEAFASVLEELKNGPILRHVDRAVKHQESVKRIDPCHALLFLVVAFSGCLLPLLPLGVFYQQREESLRASQEATIREDFQKCADQTHELYKHQEEACLVRENHLKRECAIQRRACLVDAEAQHRRALTAEFQLELCDQGKPGLKADLEACIADNRSSAERLSEVEDERDRAILFAADAYDELVRFLLEQRTEKRTLELENKRLSEELAEAKRPRTPAYPDLIELIGGGTSVLMIREREESGILIAKDFRIPEELGDLFREEHGFRTIRVMLHR